MYTTETRIIDLTVGEFQEILKGAKTTEPIIIRNDEYVRGLHGLAQILKCSKSKAFGMNKSGRFDAARVNPNEKIPLFDRKTLIHIINNFNN
jgi:hypothetical protein